MKKRIVVKDEIFADFLIKNKDNHSISASPKVIMDRCRVEQVPETFEELKELCKDTKVDLKLTKDGKIYCYEHLIAQNRTPQQMWNIIKALVGAE